MYMSKQSGKNTRRLYRDVLVQIDTPG